MAEIDILPTLTLIVGGYPLIRQGIVTVISKLEWLSIGMETGSLPAARDYCASMSPRLIILDLELDCGDIAGAIRDLKRLVPAAQILALSDRESMEFLQRIMRAGAHACVSKHDPNSELQSAACRLLHGERFISRRLQAQLMANLTSAEDKPRKAALSEREFAVLQLIGRGRTATSIARELGLSIKTIETHQRRIRIKLGLRNSEELRRHAATQLLTKFEK